MPQQRAFTKTTSWACNLSKNVIWETLIFSWGIGYIVTSFLGWVLNLLCLIWITSISLFSPEKPLNNLDNMKIIFLKYLVLCLIQAGSVMRLPKFEVDIPAASKAQKTGLLERDVTLANMWVVSHLQPPWFWCSLAKLVFASWFWEFWMCCLR